MKKIILANIGNRNITYKGKIIRDILGANRELLPKDFLSNQENPNYWNFTKWLTDPLNYEREKENLQSQISDNVIDEEIESLDKVVLFTTDQGNYTRNNQDTFFTGKILQNVYREKYPGVEFEVRVYKDHLTKTEKILSWYRNEIKTLYIKNIDHNFILVDSGGSYQMKFSLKISCEYLIPREKFTTWYVSQDQIDISKLVKSDNFEFRKIIDTIQSISLLNKLNYSSSYLLLLEINHKHKELVHFAQYRESFQPEACQNLKFLLLGKKEYSDLMFLTNYNNHSFKNSQLKELVEEEHYYLLFEMLSKIQKCIELKYYRDFFILAYSFIETCLHSICEKNTGAKLMTKFNWDSEKIVKMGTPKISDVIKFLRKAEFLSKELYFQFEKTLTRSVYQSKENLFKTERNTALNTIRNEIAHKGRGVGESEFSDLPYKDVFAKWFEMFELPEKNVYDQMNEEIIPFLK